MLLAASGAAWAQDATVIKVHYTPASGRFGDLADKAVQAVLARPGFIATATPDAKTLVVTPGMVEDRRTKGFSVTLSFQQDGDPIGEAVENCTADKLDECADQIAADFTSAAAAHH